MSQALRKLTGSISKTKCMVVFINQIRMKIGVMFGNPETTTGGNALKFYASRRLDIRRIATSRWREDVIGNRPREDRQEQGRSALPQCEFDVLFGKTMSRVATPRPGRPGRDRRQVGRLVLL